MAGAGNKLVVVDVQILTTSKYGNISEATFRILDPSSGALYGHASNFTG